MKRVAVFGNAGGGKSTIARRLAELTGLPLYVIDMMQFRAGGVKVNSGLAATGIPEYRHPFHTARSYHNAQ